MTGVIQNVHEVRNTVFYEDWDPKVLNSLIHCDKLSGKVRGSLKKIQKNLKGGNKLKVEYDFAKLTKQTGRMYPSPYDCLATIKGSVRRIITNQKFHDIDIVNCHYSIIYNLCQKYGVECEGITRYYKNRENIIRELMNKYPELTRDTIKMEFITTLNGGSPLHLQKEPLIKQIIKERDPIIYRFRCLDQFDNISRTSDRLSDREGEHDEKKRNTKFLSRVLFTTENECLACMHAVCVQNKIPVTSMIFDGMMVCRGDYNVNDIIGEMKENIRTNMRFDIDIIEKSMEFKSDDLEIIESFSDQDEAINDITSEFFDVDYPNEKAIRNNIFRYYEHGDHGNDYDKFTTYAYSLFRKIIYLFAKGNGEVIVAKMIKGKLEYDRVAKVPFQRLNNSYEYSLSKDGGKEMTYNILYDYLTDKTGKVIPTYRSMEFRPIVGCDGDCFNLFTGLEHERTVHYSEEEIKDLEQNELKTYVKHIKHNLCGGDEELYKFVDTWIGYTIKYPEIKLKTALTLSGDPGSGKGIVVDLIGRALGNKYVYRPDSTNDITSRFGGANRVESLLVFMDETHWGGDKKVKNAIKKLITETRVTVEPKFLTTFNTEMWYNVIIASNEDRIISLDKGQRRFCVLDTVKSNDPSHYQDLLNIDPQVFYNYYCSKDYQKDFINVPVPETRGSQNQMVHSLNEVSKYVLNGFLEADFAERDYICMKDVYTHYRHHVAFPETTIMFWKKFRNALPNSYNYTKVTRDGTKSYVKIVNGETEMLDDFYQANGLHLLND